MRLKTNRKAIPLALLLVLSVLSITSWTILPAHAANPTYVRTVVGSQTSVTISAVTTGDFLGIVVAPNTFSTFSGYNPATDSFGDAFTYPCGTVNSCTTTTNTFWAVAKASGTDTISISAVGGSFSGGTMWVDQYTNVAGVLGGNYRANCGVSTCGASGTDSLQSGIVAGTGVAIWEPMMYVTGTGTGSPSFTPTSATSDGISPAPQSQNRCQPITGLEACSYTSLANANFPILRVAYTSGGTNSLEDHALVLMQGGVSGSNGQVTNCYGNCGAPAITLANTNSTHTVNFNSSITLLYIFQSNVNGFMLNVTTNLAKSYTNTFNAPWLGFYTATCNPGTDPGTNACPFILQTGGATAGIAKGQVKITGGRQYPVSAGQWVALALSAQISGLDVNDTNANVQMSQTSGIIPSAILQTTIFSTASKIGLWAFIQGTIITAPPNTPPSLPACFGLDCILASVVNSSCQVVNAACQTASSMFWVLVLTIISIFLLVFMFNQIVPGINLGRVGLGEMSVLILVLWIAIFTSFNLMSLYVLALVFSIVAILMAKRVQGTLGGGI